MLGTGNVVMNCSATSSAVGAFDISPQSPGAPVTGADQFATSRTPNVNVIYMSARAQSGADYTE